LQLRCCGSPLYLKKAFGVGYRMTVEKHDPAHYDAQALHTLVQVPESSPPPLSLSHTG
jgi:hypothetical protein